MRRLTRENGNSGAVASHVPSPSTAVSPAAPGSAPLEARRSASGARRETERESQPAGQPKRTPNPSMQPRKSRSSLSSAEVPALQMIANPHYVNCKNPAEPRDDFFENSGEFSGFRLSIFGLITGGECRSTKRVKLIRQPLIYFVIKILVLTNLQLRRQRQLPSRINSIVNAPASTITGTNPLMRQAACLQRRQAHSSAKNEILTARIWDFGDSISAAHFAGRHNPSERPFLLIEEALPSIPEENAPPDVSRFPKILPFYIFRLPYTSDSMCRNSLQLESTNTKKINRFV